MKVYFVTFVLFTTVLSVKSQSLEQFNEFTPERKAVLVEMTVFFDQTIKKNFPCKDDSLSYQMFFDCLRNSDHSVIIRIDHKKLDKINKQLFKDKNYYFFYARLIETAFKRGERPEIISYQDPVPTARVYTSVDSGKLRRGPKPHVTDPNIEGYIRYFITPPPDNAVTENNKRDYEATKQLSTFFYVLAGSGKEGLVSRTREAKEFGAVVFWKYLCHCSGIDLNTRKPYCCE